MDANIQKYQAFVEVADAGSFTKAAETLAYSQSGISHMVSDLERDWGVALFERSRRGVVLTGDGARLLPEARALCESFRALEATVDEVRGLETGLIRIGVFPSVAAHWIPRIIGGALLGEARVKLPAAQRRRMRRAYVRLVRAQRRVLHHAA